jgi:hypothetical protein
VKDFAAFWELYHRKRCASIRIAGVQSSLYELAENRRVTDDGGPWYLEMMAVPGTKNNVRAGVVEE